MRRFAVPAGPGAGLLRRIAVAATWHRRRPQRLLAVHPAGRTNWPKTLGQPQGTPSQYVNLQVLKTLQASVTATATTTHRANPDGVGLADTVMITNTSAAPTVGFVLRADVRRGAAAGAELAGGNELQSSIWKRQRDHALARRVADADRYL